MDPAPTHAPPGGTAAPVDDDAGLDLDAVRDDLGAVDAALERLDAGTYGTCAACGDTLAEEALAADPTVTACGAHLPLA